MQPSTSPTLRTPASGRGGVIGFAGIVDVGALSLAARRHTMRIPLPALIQNATTNHSLGPIGMLGTIVDAYLSYRTVPLVPSGTATFRLATRTAAGVQTLISTSANLLALTTIVPAQIALTSTPDVAANDMLEMQFVVSNNAPTQGADGFLVVVFDPTDPSVVRQ